MLGRAQASANQTVGTPMQQLGFSQAVGRQGTPNVPLGLDPNVLNLEQMHMNRSLARAGIQQGNAQQGFDMIGAGLGGGLGLMGQMIGAQPLGSAQIGGGSGFGMGFTNPMSTFTQPRSMPTPQFDSPVMFTQPPTIFNQ